MPTTKQARLPQKRADGWYIGDRGPFRTRDDARAHLPMPARRPGPKPLTQTVHVLRRGTNSTLCRRSIVDVLTCGDYESAQAAKLAGTSRGICQTCERRWGEILRGEAR
jgi:hypothetical protein